MKSCKPFVANDFIYVNVHICMDENWGPVLGKGQGFIGP